MTPSRLDELLAAYGADPRRWPDAERDPAQALIKRNPEARARIAGAAALDAKLDRWANPAPLQIDPQALSAVVTSMPQRRAAARSGFRFRWPAIAWPNMAGLAAAALAGFLVGWSGLDSTLLSETNYENPDRVAVTAVIEDATW